jgi:ATP adenylyltransferase
LDKHTLIIPKRHVAEFFDLYQPEINAVHALLLEIKNEISRIDTTVTEFNVGVNVGQAAGQSIFHVHVHLIPRRDGDVERPRGGIRIPDKQDH